MGRRREKSVQLIQFNVFLINDNPKQQELLRIETVKRQINKQTNKQE